MPEYYYTNWFLLMIYGALEAIESSSNLRFIFLNRISTEKYSLRFIIS
jgi:hypothetical protein